MQFAGSSTPADQLDRLAFPIAELFNELSFVINRQEMAGNGHCLQGLGHQRTLNPDFPTMHFLKLYPSTIEFYFVLA